MGKPFTPANAVADVLAALDNNEPCSCGDPHAGGCSFCDTRTRGSHAFEALLKHLGTTLGGEWQSIADEHCTY